MRKMKFGAVIKNVNSAINNEKVQQKVKDGMKEEAKTPEGKETLNKLSKSNIGKSILTKLGLDFTQDEWKAEHEQGTVAENSNELDSIAKNAVKLNLKDNLQLEKICFICCNTYERPEYSLGVGPMNDAITVASYMKDIGFDIYYVHNPKKKEFLNYLQYFYQMTNKHLVVYYTGHGTSVRDQNGDEEDGYDEAFVFDDGYVIDDELARLLATSGKKSSCKVLLLNDCCHSGSIYDLQSAIQQGLKMPEKIMSVSAARDKETAKQTNVGSKDQGIFTFYFFKFLSTNPKMTPRQMEVQSKPYLSRYNQNFVAYSTTNGMLDQPIFE